MGGRCDSREMAFLWGYPLESPPLTVRGENNKILILLSDYDESKEHCEVGEDIGEVGRKRRMVERSRGNKRRKFIPVTCEEISDSLERGE